MSSYEIDDVLRLLSSAEKKLEQVDASHYLLRKIKEVIRLVESEFNTR